MKGHYMDWVHQPRVYKRYPESDAIRLPDVPPIQKGSLRDIYAQKRSAPAAIDMDFNLLSRILTLTCCITAKSRHRSHDFYFRSAASAGALYPCELYLVNDPIDGLEGGVYHYDLHSRSLAPLRSGKFTDFAEKCFENEETEPGFLYFFATAIFFRSAWKYRDRAFRYVLLDAGHLMENLILAIQSIGLRFSIHYDYNDRDCERLLGIDGKREGILACIAIHNGSEPAGRDVLTVDALPDTVINTSTVSEKEVCYEEIESFYRATGKLPNASAKCIHLMDSLGHSPEAWSDIEPQEPGPGELPYPDALFRRRSKRNYVDAPLSRAPFMRLMEIVCRAATRGVSPRHRYASAVIPGFITGDIEAISSGFYLLDSNRLKYTRIMTGSLTSRMATVCLDQQWLRHAAVHFLFLTNLAVIDRTWGPRSYRYAMLAAGRIGQAIYVGATAMGLGACGIGALYDDEARELLGLADDAALLYLVAVGPVKK